MNHIVSLLGNFHGIADDTARWQNTKERSLVGRENYA